MNDESFAKLLRYFNLSWSGYRKVRKGVKKRIARHMQAVNTKSLDSYLELLDKLPEARKECEKCMTVSISRFFRDGRQWAGLEKEVFPDLVSSVKKAEKFLAWSCGCARGEEVYSFKIVWERWKNSSQKLPELEFWATDLNPDYIEKAVDGCYEPRSLKEIPASDRDFWFDKVPGKKRRRVKSFLKGDIIFRRHNFLHQSPPAECFHLIFLRNNLLTYYRSPEKEAVFERIVNALRTGGVLMIGSHEKIPQGFDNLRQNLQFDRLFTKNCSGLDSE